MHNIHDSAYIKQQLKRLELMVKKKLHSNIQGLAPNVQRGTGFLFEQLTDYNVGDDVRFIDWNASARSNSLLVKRYLEERSRPTIIALDTSASLFWGADGDYAWQTSFKVASTLAIIAHYLQDPIGLLVFSDTVERFIPPRTGRDHLMMILDYITAIKPTYKRTQFQSIIQAYKQYGLSRNLLLIVSDFIDETLTIKNFNALSHSCQIYGFNVDASYQAIAACPGIMHITDPETDKTFSVDLRKGSKSSAHASITSYQEQLTKKARASRMPIFTIRSANQVVPELIAICEKIKRY